MIDTLDITDLMKCAGIEHSGLISLTSEMSGLEVNPKDDWLYYALLSFKMLFQERGHKIHSAAFIGSGNGIETIAALKIFQNLESVYVTDLLENILPDIEKNIRENAEKELRRTKINFLSGRDCLPLQEKVDLIYGNLPLVMADAQEVTAPLATTTLTDTKAYMQLSLGRHDALRKYSLLSQLGFLISAKEKLNENGRIITLIGGRIPYEAVEECFGRAGLKYKHLLTGFKKQSDPVFLRQYAKFEKKEKIKFVFYDYGKASEILISLGFDVPNIIVDYDERQLKEILKSTQINANQAYALAKKGRDVGHLAFAFVAYN